MVRLSSLALLLLPALAMASLRGVDDSDNEGNLLLLKNLQPRRRELMANMMFSVTPGRGGRGDSDDEDDDDSSDEELTTSECKGFTCSSTACTTNKGKFAGNVGCLSGSEFCVRSNKWSQACRGGITCGSCDGTIGGGEEEDDASCEQSCSATSCLVEGGSSGVEICNPSSNETLCVTSQDAWMNLCNATEATCGACGTTEENDDSSSMDEDDSMDDCGNETISEFCTPIADDENTTYIHGGPGAAGGKVARCGDVRDLCDTTNSSCGSQTVDNQSPSGGTFKINCATLVKGNSIMRRNFAAACCVEQDFDFGNSTSDSEEDSEEGDGGNNGNGNGNNGNGNGNGNNGNGNGNGNNGNGNSGNSTDSEEGESGDEGNGNNGNGNGNGNNGNGNGNNGNGNGAAAGIEIEGVGNITFVDDASDDGNSTDFESDDDGNSTSIDDDGGNSTDFDSVDDGNSTLMDDSSGDGESEEGNDGNNNGNNGNGNNGDNGNGNGQGSGADSEEEGDEGSNNGNGNGNGNNGNGMGNNGNNGGGNGRNLGGNGINRQFR